MNQANRHITALVERIDRRLKATGLSARRACLDAGLSAEVIRNFRRGANGDTRFASASFRSLDALAPVLGTTTSWLLDGTGPEEPTGDSRLTVPVVGYVGAGREAHFYDASQGPLEYVEELAPGRPMSAVRVKGDSMKPDIQPDWLLYFDNERKIPDDELVNRKAPSIVGLEDGRILVKRVCSGSSPETFHLLSTNDEPLVDVRISWICKISLIVPTS